jgi:HEAT repeat protein
VGRLGLVAALMLPVLAGAQVPLEQDQPRTRLRDRYRTTPQTTQRLDDNVRKLKSDDPEERLEGVKGLGETNDPKAVEYLLGAASDPDMRIRVKAIDVLGQIHANEATPILIQRLFMRDTDVGTKQHILASLGKIGDDRATKPIVDFMLRDMETEIRGNAVFALGEIGDKSALPALETIAKEDADPRLRNVAAEAIRKINEKPAPEVVPPALAGDRRRQQEARPQ